MNHGFTKESPHAGSSAGVVAMPVSENQVPDSGRVESVALDVLEDARSTHPGADIDQRQLGSAVDQVHVAVVGVGQVEAVAARTDEVDALREPHALSKLKL